MATAVAVEPKIPKRIGETEEIKTSYAIPLWLRDLQIASSIKAVEKRIEPVAEGTKLEETIAVVGFGPSLQDTWEQVRDYKTIFTCSGAHKFLLDKGLTPEGRTWYHVEVDPREHKIQLLGEPRPGIIYLPSSTCHPAYFDHLKKFDADIRLWHVFDNSADAVRVLPRGEWAITGGSNVGLRCMTIARFFGFYKMDVFGVDGCEKVGGEEKRKHAAAHPLQDGVPFALYEYEGVDYRTTQSLLHCARETFHELDMMPDVQAKFFGEGLVQEMAKHYKPTPRDPKQIAAIAFQPPELISDEYRELNRKLHAENLFYGVGGKKHAEIVVKLKEQTKAESVLDYGCQPPDAKVLTPCGWREIGSIKVGDSVIGSQGHAIKVTGTHGSGVVPIYKVSFRDGSSLVVDGDHPWAVRTSNHQKRSQPFMVKKTRDLIGDLHWENAAPLKWRIPMVSPVEFPATTENVVHPYLLGLLIGDGGLSASCAVLFTIRDDIAAAAEAVLPMAVGLSVAVPGKSYRLVGISGRRGIKNPITDGLRACGLWGLRSWEKFIPTPYLLAPSSDRIALLQGLIDSDGEVTGRHLSYSTTSPRLAGDMAFLVESLGGTARIIERKRTTFEYKGERRTGRAAYVVSIKVPRQIRPTRVKAWTPRREYHPNRVIASIEPCGESVVVGLSVDAADHLYVTEHCIVTHNSGKGFLAEALPFPIWEYDPAILGKDAEPRPADLVVCTDCLEHVEGDKILFVLDDLRRVTKQIGYFVIHTGPSSKLLADGRNAHILQRDTEWWLKMISKFFKIGQSWAKHPLITVVVEPLKNKPKKLIGKVA